MGGEVAHAICTDPPYAINYLGGRAAQEERIGAKRRGAEEANSDTYRNRAWDWYRSTAYTRLEPGGALILIMTRWHEDDLAEAAKSGEQWHVISLPALAEANDALGRQPGEALWPARYPVEQLEQIRASIGPYWWQALYQQRPSPPEGALFRAEWWRYWEPETLPTRWDEMLLSVDASYKARSDNSYTAVGVWGRKGLECYLLHQWRRQCGFAEARDAVAATAKQYPQARIILIEDKANGRAIIESLQAVVAGIVPVDPKGGKFSRAQAVSPMVEQGHVWLPQPARLPWVQEFLAEARTFPVGLHDDQVDQMTQALQWWIWVKDQPLPPQPELTIPQQRAAMADASDRRPVGAGRSPRWRMRQ
jgi:predicted phage terminase large subunit-like protein